MVFERIGRLATNYRVPVIVAWIGVAILVTLFAPNIEHVSSSDQADILPSDVPFVHAAEVYEEAFPDQFAPSNTIIVIDAHDAGGVLNLEGDTFEAQTDTETVRFINDVVAWLSSEEAPDNIKTVISPTMSSSTLALMVSPDNNVAFLRVDLTTSGTEEETEATLIVIDDWLQEHRPATLGTYQTGLAPIAFNTSDSITTSVDRTIYVTVVLVIIMLLAVYRSPVSPFIPLAVVTVAYLITRGIVAYLGENFMTITSYANVLLVVVMYGAGTDYCLFLISRFREEMADDSDVKRATARTVHRVGETITSSAGTIFVGFMAMIFSEMGIFKTTGPALAIGIVIVLLAGLTFVPALLTVLGHRAFWPGKATHRSTGRWYEFTSRLVSTRPLLTVVVIVILMIPLSVYGINQAISYDLLADMPDDKDSIVGFDLLEESLGSGYALPLTIVLTERNPGQTASDIMQLTEELSAIEGIADIRSLNSPLGLANSEYNDLLRVDVQLGMALDMLSSAQADPSGGATIDPEQIVAALGGVQGYLDLLVESFPEIAEDESLLTIQEMLANPLTLILRQDDFSTALGGLIERFSPEAKNPIENPYILPTVFAEIVVSFPQTDGELSGNLLEQLTANYLANEGTAFKLDVILDSLPISTQAMDTLLVIRDVLADYSGEGDAVASGSTAMNTDIRDTMDRDLARAIGFVLLGIFIVLLLMLRSMIAPLYLIGTVVLSFTFTLGLTNLVFKTLFDIEGLTWYAPFFIFVFLVALGIDYSIFLFGRVKEEVGNHGLREGVHVAVATTGAIITSAGIILAGTFAAMMSGEIMGLVELGFAVSVGVLIDTFVVRTVLDPALAALFGKWTWWPGGIPKASRAQPSLPQMERSTQPGD